MQLTDGERGRLLAPNQVIYRDVFESLKADMLYTYGKGFFEAEAILRENPVLPDGFKPESTVLQVVTEFIDPPTPDQSRPGIFDFGMAQMIQGKAFSLSEQSSRPFVQSVNGKTVSVNKQWTQIGARHVLVESANYQDIQPQLAALPQSKIKSTQRVALMQELPPRPETKPDSKEEIQVASAGCSDKGFVMDYLIVSGTGSYTFASRMTYLINSSGYFSGTVTFQTIVSSSSTPMPTC